MKHQTIDSLEKRLQSHRDVHGIHTRQLNWGLWYVAHRRQFLKITVTILVILITWFWGYSLYNFAEYLLRGYADQQQNLQGLTTDPIRAVNNNRVANLDAQFIALLPLGQGAYDLAGQITNANEDYWLEFDYYFVAGGASVGKNKSFVLPGQKKYLLSFNQSLSGYPTAAELVIVDLSWHRVDRHSIADWQTFLSEHFNFIIQDQSFLGADASNLSENLPISRLQFTVINDTAYSYQDVKLQILLWNNAQLVGVTKHDLNRFLAGAKKTVDLNLVGSWPRVSKIEILPEINIMDETVFADVY